MQASDLSILDLPPLLELLPGEAYLVDAAGRVTLANAAGQRRIAAEGDGWLRQVVAGGDVPGWKAAKLGAFRLVVAQEPPRDAPGRAGLLAGRWGLTPRQQEVLALAALGESNKAIAKSLGCAESTVELHMTRLMARAGVESRAGLVARFWMG